MFAAKDTPGNLEAALGTYREQVQSLMASSWRGKSFRVFLFGDYEFQCHNYGISGASGARPCLLCHCLKASMRLPPEQQPATDKLARSLQSLDTDLQAFKAAGARLSDAKKYNNVIRRTILPVPLTDAVVPALHLNLGIFLYLYRAFEKELQKLDQQLAKQCTAAADTDREAFTKLVELHRDHVGLQHDISTAEQACLQHQHQLQYVMQTVHAIGQDVVPLAQQIQTGYAAATRRHADLLARRQQLETDILKLSGSKDFLGPCQSSLDPVLQQCNVKRQAYYSGTFNGNHVSTALKPAVVAALTEAPVQIVRERCPELLPDAKVIAARYSDGFSKYAACTEIFSHSTPVDDDVLLQLQINIEDFLKFCRAEVVERGYGHITPKLHLLEYHVVPLMERVKFGIGLLGEQGAESLHSAMNQLESAAKNTPSSLQRLKSVADQHLLACVMEGHRPSARKD